MKNQAFTLIELLVVVLIIGILAAIAVPQYQESVEKSIMQEAITNLRAIARANDVFFMANGRYANHSEITKLDITIPGEIKGADATGLSGERIMTKYFIYSPNTGTGQYKASAMRVKEGLSDYQHFAPYAIRIRISDNSLMCEVKTEATSIQRKLCLQVRDNGYL